MVLLHELCEFFNVRTVNIDVSRIYSCLRNVKSIFHVQNKPVASLYGSVSDLHYLEELFILMFIAIDLEYVFNTVQEMIECSLMLKDKQVYQVPYCSPLLWHILDKSVNATDSILHSYHIFTQLLINFVPF